MRKLRRLRWRGRKAVKFERRFFETVFVELMREMKAEGEQAARSPEKIAGYRWRGSAGPETRID